MTCFRLGERARLSIELALTAASHDRLLRQRQDSDAKLLGLTGAEIDAARRGWSFDVRTSAAIALAMASAESDDERLQQQRAKALKAGIAEKVWHEIETLVECFAHHSSRKAECYA